MNNPETKVTLATRNKQQKHNTIQKSKIMSNTIEHRENRIKNEQSRNTGNIRHKILHEDRTIQKHRQH
jgi:hypothetical protein